MTARAPRSISGALGPFWRLGTVKIMRTAGVSKTAVWRWQARFKEAGVEGALRNKTRPAWDQRLAIPTRTADETGIIEAPEASQKPRPQARPRESSPGRRAATQRL